MRLLISTICQHSEVEFSAFIQNESVFFLPLILWMLRIETSYRSIGVHALPSQFGTLVTEVLKMHVQFNYSSQCCKIICKSILKFANDANKFCSTKLCEPCSAFSLVLLTPASYGIRIRNGMAKFFNPVPYLKLCLKGVFDCSIKGVLNYCSH